MVSLPSGYAVELHDDVKILRDGRLLLGHSPPRGARLTPSAADCLRNRRLIVTGHRSAMLASHLIDTDLALPVVATGARVTATDLTVVIPVKDRADALRRALSALGPRLNVIVVDDGSRQPHLIAEVARRFGARLIALPVNGGPSAARNLGATAAKTPFVAFVDSDIQVSADNLLDLTRHFSDSMVAIVAPRVRGLVVNGSGKWYQRYDRGASSLDLGARSGLVRPGNVVSWLSSACIVARASDFGRGFDESMRSGEDVDLVWRTIANGKRVRYDASVTALHESRSTAARWLGRKFVYGSSAAPLAVRHPSAIAPAALSPKPALAALSLLVLRPLVAAPLTMLFLGGIWRRLGADLPNSSAMRITAMSLGWHLRLESSLLLRHWWPLTVVGMSRSSRVRKLVWRACVVDFAVARATRPDTSLLGAIVCRRLDDLAYGAGVWFASVRHRNVLPVLPRLRSTGSRPKPSCRSAIG